ncbi:LysM peptidoglycan-binding domain-containing protein [Capnocytophaga sp. G2]|uniref:LysM peptidoglycan-binding domain-containing protein n=1 Tax=Capnocytophaga sp. G2 TaxID=3110695 RepID=UPI002B458EF9|nr:LysM peptidoglycan-binding domain-containing protein [Capnocytophaga sp. G2]MEB3005976.1 LysM peptidoglycan-binding domain-containing protein [Capnocytophaga sp. G2]
MSRIYKVKKGDTLQLIAEKLQISVNDLRHYHNMRCELWELLEQKLTSKTERIIVPSEEELASLQGHQQAVLKEQERPSRYLDKKFYAKDYKVKEVVITSDKEVKTDYSLSLQMEKAEKGWSMIVNTTYEEADTKFTELATACMQAMQPLKYHLSINGGITDIENHREIIERFTQKRIDIEGYFEGELAKSYTDTFYEKLIDKEYILERLQMSFLNQVLFPRMEWFHKDNEKWEEGFCPVQGSDFIPYELETEVIFEEYEIVTIVKGTLKRNYNLWKLTEGFRMIDNITPFESAFTITYAIERNSSQLYAIEAVLDIYFEGELYRKNMLGINKRSKL